MFKPRHLDHLPLYADMASKVSWLNQHQCPTCSTGSSSVALRTFPIEVPPWSHQVKIARQIGPALRKAIQANPMYASHFKPLDYGGVCLRLLFVLDDGARMKDCDNMAKGLIDAFQGLLYGNDRQVEHLDVLNIHGATGSNGYILVRFQGTNLNDHGDVIDPTHGRIAWLDAESLRLHDFLALEA
jgi:hypothetical protein